jgi:hypothetical protein
MSSDDFPSVVGSKAFRGKAGALETWQLFKFGPDTIMDQHMANLIAMLGPDGSMAEIKKLSDIFNERAKIRPDDVLEYCIEATGARPDPSNDADFKASTSFAPMVHICATRLLIQTVVSEKNKAMAHYLLRRIAKWWRWRSTGLDRARVRKEAVASLNSGANEGRRDINARRKAAASVGIAAASEIAADKWRENASLSASAMASYVQKELSRRKIISATGWTPSVDIIHRSIGPLRPNYKVGCTR